MEINQNETCFNHPEQMRVSALCPTRHGERTEGVSSLNLLPAARACILNSDTQGYTVQTIADTVQCDPHAVSHIGVTM